MYELIVANKSVAVTDTVTEALTIAGRLARKGERVTVRYRERGRRYIIEEYVA